MRKIFLFLFAAVLSIGTAMAEVVTITENQCTLEYEVDGRALLITGDYLGDSFSLTLLSENDIDLTAESFVCDVQTLNIADWSKYADRGTATVTVYPEGIGITATGLYDIAGDDPNTYDLVDLWATPKEAAGGGDIPYDMEFTVDMTGLEATFDPLLTFAASGLSTDMSLGAELGTVVTYLECSWEMVDGAYPVDLANSYLTLADHSMLGEVLGGSVVPVIDETIGEAGAIVSATAVVYVAFEGMGTFKFTLNMTAGNSEEPGEPGESSTLSVQVWNATLSEEYGTLMVNGSMNGLAVHAEVPGFEFVPDTWDWFDYSNVLVEVGTWVEEGESDYVGVAYGNATVELDQHTVTLTGKLTSGDGTQFDVYIQGSLQPANPMTSTTLTMEGMTKSEVIGRNGNGYTQLEDDSYNTIEIYNLQANGTFAYGDYLKVIAGFDEPLEGYGSWKEVDGVETLVATLYDDYYTKVYHVTATASAQQTFTITSSNATYVVDAEYGDVTFRGVAEEGGEFEIVVGNSVEGQYAYGYWGETEIAATEITDFGLAWGTTYMLGGSFLDNANNIYDVWITADPAAVEPTTIDVTLSGMVATPSSRMGNYSHLSLDDEYGNQFSIYNGSEGAYGYDLDVTGYLAEYDVTVSGTGDWQLVDGVETLTATLQVEDDNTTTYNITATVAIATTITLECLDATYTITDPEYNEVTFTGVADGKEFTILVSYFDGEYYSEGEWGETFIFGTEVEFDDSDAESYYLSGTYVDDASNTYEVLIFAAPEPTPDYTRTVSEGSLGTICLPNGSDKFEGAEFYALTYKKDGYIYAVTVNTLEAGVPYVFKATSTELKVYYNEKTASKAGSANGLYGTFTDIEDGEAGTTGNQLEGKYLLVAGNKVQKCGGNCSLAANRAYFVVSEISDVEQQDAPGRKQIALGYQEENQATGVDNITENGVVAPALQGTYDILGRQLSEPAANGFYIINGKKVLVVK